MNFHSRQQQQEEWTSGSILSQRAAPWIDATETIYSYCGFVHRLTRARSSAETARGLLGAPHAVRQHELPRSLAPLQRFAPAAFASPLEALHAHTVAGYYLPFLSLERQEDVASRWANGHWTHGRRVTGISTRTLAIAHPLRWCPACVGEDLERLGRAMWKTCHQYPTTFECTRHNQPLICTAVTGKTWAQAGDAGQLVPTRRGCTDVLASSGDAIAQTRCFGTPALRQAVLARLADLGVIHSPQRVRHDRLERWFRQTPIGLWLASAPNGLDALQHGDWIAKLLWKHRQEHAVRWVVLWSALSWPSPQECGQELVSISAEVQTWPRPSAPAAFESAARDCLSYEAIASQLGASRSDVVRWFEAYPSLRANWRARWLAQRRHRAQD
jgi:hypothetical protein